MQLKIKQRAFAWGDTYDIFDENGEAKYFVKQKVLALGKQIYVYNKTTDEEVGAIKQRLFSLMPQFEVYVGGTKVGCVRKELTLLNQNFTVDFRGWQVKGDPLGLEYRVMQEDRVVMSVSSDPSGWTDAYILSFDDPADELPGLLLALTLDAVEDMKD